MGERGLRHGCGSACSYITRMPRDAIGLDIGGANLKAATASGEALTVPFELWRHPERLTAELGHVRRRWPELDAVAVTMTGELCDCFPTKRDGVRHILAAVQEAFAGARLHVWTTEGTLACPGWVAEHSPLSAAATNWLALAAYVGRLAPNGGALLIDTGSTTTDVIPLWDGEPIPTGRTDPERLRSGELVYTGVRRTPVCALLGAAVAAEFFATAHDVHVALGHLPEEPDNCATADGRPMTRSFAHARLSRMLGGDPEVTTAAETTVLARQAATQQVSLIARAVHRVTARLREPPRAVILSGSGEFLARQAWAAFAAGPRTHAAGLLSLAEWTSPACSDAACAHALAVLAAEAAQ